MMVFDIVEPSQPAQSLVSNLLQVRPEMRYTIDQVLNDPWMIESEDLLERLIWILRRKHLRTPGPLAYWNCKWEHKRLGIERDFELMGMEKRRLLRLRPDYVDAEDWAPSKRAEFITIVAREALGMGHCELIGGFLRDWIIRGEDIKQLGTPKGIDLRL